MKKFNSLVIILCLLLSACSSNVTASANTGFSDASDNSAIDDTTSVNDNQTLEETPNCNPEPIYFESDEVINKFFTDYNAIAEIAIPTEKIEEGNIKTKALAYIDDLNLEVTNADNFLSISMSSSVENENTKLYAVFRDTIQAMNASVSENNIQTAWEAIHQSGYLVEDYNLNGISISYVPSKELSWGTSALRIDLKFPLN